MDINIRHVESKDYRNIEEMTREAFWNLYKPGCDEHYTTHMIRNHYDYIDDLDYVAEINKKIVGNIVYTKSRLYDENNNSLDTVTFGPLCVHPKYQRIGIGTKLINYTKELVIEKGYPAIIIYGDPHNYCKQGFKNGKDYNISTIDGRYPLGLLALELKK
jgi:predicted N-acetyltransferase YhbS